MFDHDEDIPDDLEEALAGAVEKAVKDDAKDKEIRAANFALKEEKLDADWEVIQSEPDLLKRVRLINKLIGIDLFDAGNVVAKKSGDSFVSVPNNDYENARVATEAMFYGRYRPYFDEFKGRYVSHEGTTLDADSYDAFNQIKALRLLGLPKCEPAKALSIMRDVAKNTVVNSVALRVHSILEGVVWDGVPRIESYLETLFGCIGTKYTDAVSKYWFLALYNRVTNPGCLAPITLSLIGAQNNGKSYFYELTTRYVLQDKFATAVPFNVTHDMNRSLRNIIGKTIIATNAEMAGFGKAQMETLKDFLTRTVDTVDFKFENSVTVPRQFVTVADGNSYEGFQRDATGNRRMFPLFVGQLPMESGQYKWREGYQVDFDQYTEEIFWQLMAECRDWFAKHGQMGYLEMVRETIKLVAEFNKGEIDSYRGHTRDDFIDLMFDEALTNVSKTYLPPLVGRGRPRQAGVFIKCSDLALAIKAVPKVGQIPDAKKISAKMKATFGVEVTEKQLQVGNKYKRMRGWMIDLDFEWHKLYGCEDCIGDGCECGFDRGKFLDEFCEGKGGDKAF